MHQIEEGRFNSTEQKHLVSQSHGLKHSVEGGENILHRMCKFILLESGCSSGCLCLTSFSINNNDRKREPELPDNPSTISAVTKHWQEFHLNKIQMLRKKNYNPQPFQKVCQSDTDRQLTQILPEQIHNL
jgi:hypothetical protein